MEPTLSREFPILEYDPSPNAVIEAAKIIERLDGITHCVLCYFKLVTEQLVNSGRATQIAMHGSEMGPLPLYTIEYDGQRVAVMQAPVGAPFAAALLEELIARGMTKFLVCGGCGVLDRQIAVGHLLVPTSAVRDEGTSYHYLPPAREVTADARVVQALVDVLTKHNHPYLLTKTWTTDAIYRETPALVRLRRSEGCLAVEMEAAAYMAVAQFRGVQFGQLLYAGDDISGEDWDHRGWQDRASVREQVFWLAVEACLSI
ncbi:MAG: nucleoside phosphorylase [Anaerolineae bacterium]